MLKTWPLYSVFGPSRQHQLVKVRRPKNESRTESKQKPAQPAPPGLLRLPVELRNQIYGYLITRKLVTIKRKQDWPFKDSTLLDAMNEYREPSSPKAIKSIKIVIPGKAKSQRTLQKAARGRALSYDGFPGQKPLDIRGVNWELSLNSLLLTCRTLYAEASPILYGLTVFYFDDAKRLRGFLKAVTPFNLSCITRLHVHVRIYGIAANTAHNICEQRHTRSWTDLFTMIATRMTNLRTISVTFSMRSVTDGLQRAFRPVKDNTDWKERAGFMLMLQSLSGLPKLKELRVKIRATDYEMQKFTELHHSMMYNSWKVANIHPILPLRNQLYQLHTAIFDRMHHTLEQAMKNVGRSKDADEAFKPVMLATREYLDFVPDPIGYMLGRME